MQKSDNEVFYKLIDESQITDIDVYETPGYLEYQAQQVEEKAINLYKTNWKPPVKGGKKNK